MIHRDEMRSIQQGVKMGFDLGTFRGSGRMVAFAEGVFIFDLRDVHTGEQIAHWTADKSGDEKDA